MQTSGTKILVIDDDEIIQMQIKEILRQGGFHPLSALNEEIGITKALEERPDLILLDRNFDDATGGNRVLMALKENAVTAPIPVIMLTGDKRTSDIQTSLQLGAKDYITKPCKPERLITGINKALGRG